MSTVAVEKLENGKHAPVLLLQELAAAFEAIQRRAFEIFEQRGGGSGKDVDDWTQAERDLFLVPQADVAETEADFKIQIAVPGFDATDLRVVAETDGIIVRGSREARSYHEFEEKSLFRRFALAPIDVDSVRAEIKNGTLTITVRKKTALKNVATAA